MNNRQKILSGAVIIACSAMSTQTQAVLASNAILKFNAGVKTTTTAVINGTTYKSTAISGSWFSMDTNGDGKVTVDEQTAISPNVGVALGKIQPASGSHPGAPDGTESFGIDRPWSFFGNTGMHQTTSAIKKVSDDGAGTVTLDFSGWNVTWNKIASIPMGGDAANYSTDNNIANLTCYTNSTKATITDCLNGTFFVLDHTDVHVPKNDPSNFGGVPYKLHLEGTIFVPPAMTTNNTSIGAGTYATAASSSDGRISMAALVAQGVADDSSYTFNGGLYDFTVTTSAGAAAVVEMTLTAPIPANAVYRKYNGTSWVTFVADANNKIASAAKVSGTCPAVGAAAYNHTNGLVKGDECMELTIANDGTYDDNTLSNTTVDDPGGVAAAVQTSVDTRTSGTSGCSMSDTPVKPGDRADWWLVAGFFGVLAWLRLYRRRSINRS